MPTAPSSRNRWLRRSYILRLRFTILALGVASGFFCSQISWAQTAVMARTAQALAPKAKPSPTPKRPYDKKWGKLEGTAVWYTVPANSLAKRRAGKNELTAAHNRLPLGTMVRVTHLANGKTAVVRITDRGITSRRVIIDLCKEAAEKLGMLSAGSARVRLEILPDDEGTHKAPRPKTIANKP
jgi:rare lipoprotein A